MAEIVEWRIAELLGQARDLVCNVQRNAGGQPTLFLPGGASGAAFPRGDLDAIVDGACVVACVCKIAVNRVIASRGARENLLPGILRRWFGEDAGRPGTGFKVRLRRIGDRVALEPLSLALSREIES
ncbi:MAG: hypothetical protein ACKOUS_01410 [Alphaproteobacteria bacterium]